jgi:hypothetical protein
MNVTLTMDDLSDNLLERVTGGLNPQPLPPDPPPDRFSIRTLNFKIFSIARFFSFGR